VSPSHPGACNSPSSTPADRGSAGCGPAISETRMAYYPPREESCELDLVRMDMHEMAPGGRWEVVGYVTLQERGVADPFSETKASRGRAPAKWGMR